MKINKSKIKNFFSGLLWLTVGAGCITLLVSGVRTKEAKRCRGVQIDIFGAGNDLFIDRHDVYRVIKNYGGDSIKRQSLSDVDLRKIEHELKKELWVKNAELFFDNNNILKVSVEEREPVARIFTVSGESFYIDSSCMMLPLSDKISARLPVFTGFAGNTAAVSRTDSFLLNDIKEISIRISADSFLMAMIDQVDITQQRSFEMLPKIGRHNIIFGDGSDADEKFAKLKLFYKDVISKAGWNRYNQIDLQYRNQVVAKIMGKEDIIADSIRTMQSIKLIAENAARRSADSSQTVLPERQNARADSAFIQQSMQREEHENPGAVFPADNDTVATAKPVSSSIGAGSAKPVSGPQKRPVSINPLPKKTVAKPVRPAEKKSNDY